MSCTMRPSSRIRPFLVNMSLIGVCFMTLMTAAASVVPAAFTAALLHDVGGVLFQILPERIIRGEEEPGIEALLDRRTAGHIGLRERVEYVVHGIGTAGLVGEPDRAGSVEDHDPVARFRDFAGGECGGGSRDVEQHFDVLVVEHVARDVGGKIGLVEMVGG